MIFERLKKVVAEQIDMDVEEIKLESTFSEDLGIDSLDIFEIVMELEEEFKIEIPTEDLEGMDKIEDLVVYVNGKLNQ
ncbi:acyl carrier protein [Clostridium grantii]|jgi:acyl carrier protein|uniref:Acyl carrier protein n=1 Tax=Clostridium grantii DSM 8605 TaxID=1121316 RepID=A0A1M5W489_9CLOT|nr:acyl carrier protein [Clostridium grantii]SHH82270.1 acyl carrier protein [Clostridium grantii DSM 8605]